MKRFSFILVSVLAAACVGEASVDSGGGGGGGDGTGGGSGSGGGGGGGDGSGTGTGSGSGDGGGSTSMTATKFLDEINKKFCDQAFTCKASFPTDVGVTFDAVFGASSTACQADAAQFIMPAAVEQQITAGKINFNPADATSCIAGITFGTCTEFWQTGGNFPQSCATALVGTVADGGACVTHIDCTNANSYCENAKCTPDASGARVVTPEIPWHFQTPEILKTAD